jgi:hypothetical protein
MSLRLPTINLFSYLSLVIFNFLAIRIPFFGRTPGNVSDLFPTLLTPAEFAFKIWWLIYVLLGVFAFYQIKSRPNEKEKIPKEVSAIGWLFFISCILNFVWLLTWQSMHIEWAFLSIFGLWIILITINYRLTILGNTHWAYRIPFSVYLGWVCVAALANLNIILINLDFGFFGLTEESWTALLIGIGVCGTFLILYLNQDLTFTLVLIWAFYGIHEKNYQLSNGENVIVSATIIAIIILVVAGSWVGWKKWNRKKHI